MATKNKAMTRATTKKTAAKRKIVTLKAATRARSNTTPVKVAAGKAQKAPIRAAKPVRAVKVTRASARAFVLAARLPAATKPARRRDVVAPATAATFAESQEQAAVVGSDLVAFTAGVPAARREDLCNATLLAQLSANRKVPDRSDVMAWFDAYFTALMNLGWSVQQTGFRDYTGDFDGLETHEAVRNVAAALLAPNPAALAVLAATLDAMQSMDKDSPWITIFNREHRDTKTTHFQIALADQLPNGGLVMQLMAFSLEANAKLTQVLFFKLRKKRVKLLQNSGQAIVDVGVLASVRDALKKRLAERVTDFIATVDI